jgi:uncharacterized membrane-anchored protein
MANVSPSEFDARAPEWPEHRAAILRMLNKVPEVTVYFWIIKVLATTVGETAADYLGEHLNLSLTSVTYIMSTLLVVALVFQFRSRSYTPAIYWVSVVLISVVGTLITDNLVDHFGVSLKVTTAIFSAAMLATFAAWYRSEKTLSIHSIRTPKREAFYWSAILFTFALGTAAGDLVAESLKLGYWKSAILFAGLIGLVAFAWRRAKLNAVLGFWIAYVLTRPLGASIGDYLSQVRKTGGLGFGTITTSALFLVTILVVVIYLTVTKKDQIPGSEDEILTARA